MQFIKIKRLFPLDLCTVNDNQNIIPYQKEGCRVVLLQIIKSGQQMAFQIIGKQGLPLSEGEVL